MAWLGRQKAHSLDAMMTNRRFAAVAVVVVVVLVASVVGVVDWWRSTHRFDAAQWRAAGRNYSCQNGHRQRMVGDLRAHHLHSGMSMAAVTRLLGPPSEVDRWPNRQMERQDRYDRAHSKQEFGLTRAEYDKFFPPHSLPQRGVTLSWITGSAGSDCTDLAVYFVAGRLAGVDVPI